MPWSEASEMLGRNQHHAGIAIPHRSRSTVANTAPRLSRSDCALAALAKSGDVPPFPSGWMAPGCQMLARSRCPTRPCSDVAISQLH